MKGQNINNLAPDEAAERFKMLQYKILELQVEKAWTQFEEAGFRPILIKGWAAARFYPKPYRRQFVDIDLLISPDRFDAALKFSENFQGNFPVDLHRGARHLDTVAFEDLFSNSLKTICGGTEIRVLRPEDHLRVICVHWLNDGGANLEKLWDIFYAIENRSGDFDWDRLLNTVSRKRRRWIVCAIGLAHRYLGLKVEDTPVAEEAKKLPAWLTKAVEKEWASEVKLLPLHYFLKNKKMLWKQIKKRIPPNPIQATVELDGDFDRHPRIGYQLADLLVRIKPSVQRINKVFSSSRRKEVYEK